MLWQKICSHQIYLYIVQESLVMHFLMMQLSLSHSCFCKFPQNIHWFTKVNIDGIFSLWVKWCVFTCPQEKLHKILKELKWETDSGFSNNNNKILMLIINKLIELPNSHLPDTEKSLNTICPFVLWVLPKEFFGVKGNTVWGENVITMDIWKYHNDTHKFTPCYKVGIR